MVCGLQAFSSTHSLLSSLYSFFPLPSLSSSFPFNFSSFLPSFYSFPTFLLCLASALPFLPCPSLSLFPSFPPLLLLLPSFSPHSFLIQSLFFLLASLSFLPHPCSTLFISTSVLILLVLLLWIPWLIQFQNGEGFQERSRS